jgi:hypothetical protein
MTGRRGANYALKRLALDVVSTTQALYLAAVLRPLLLFGMPITAEYTRVSPIIYALVVLIWTGISLMLSEHATRTLGDVDEAHLVIAAVTSATITPAGVLYFSFREISRR